eukprot:6178877-Pleurochrysis_carterae.AAC.3
MSLAQFGTRPDREAAAARHLSLPSIRRWGFVSCLAPPCTESSIPIPLATNPVTRQLAFNAMSP